MGSTEVVKVAECGCCGMWEDCTVEYIGWVKARFGGVWVCGLCAEAIKDDQARLGLGVEAALRLHAKFRDAADAVGAMSTADIAHSLIRLLKRVMISTASTNTGSSS